MMPVVHMHCLHVSSVAGSLRSLNCGNATGLCSGVCLETLANPGNHGASVVLLDRTFRAPGSNPELFFFHTLFSAESHAGPPIKGRKTVFILARHQVCTVHEKSRNQSHRPGSRLGMVESGSGSVRSWPRGGRAPSPLVAPSVGMESSDDAKACMPAWVRMADHREMRAVTVACRRCWGVDCALVCANNRRNCAASALHLPPTSIARTTKRHRPDPTNSG